MYDHAKEKAMREFTVGHRENFDSQILTEFKDT